MFDLANAMVWWGIYSQRKREAAIETNMESDVMGERRMKKFQSYYVKDKDGYIVMEISSNGKQANVHFPRYEMCKERYIGCSPMLINFYAEQVAMLIFAYDEEEGKKFIRFLKE